MIATEYLSMKASRWIQYPSAQNKDTTSKLYLILNQTNFFFFRKVRPNWNSYTKLNISVNLYVDVIGDISETDMHYEMTVFFRQFWRDPRLAWGTMNKTRYERFDGNNNINPEYLKDMWLPDIFFKDEKGQFNRFSRVWLRVLH